MEEIKELGVKVANKEEAFWIDMKRQMLDSIDNAHRNIEMNEEIVKLCDKKIAKYKKK